MLLADHCVQMVRENVTKTSPHNYYIIFLEVVGCRLSLFAKAKSIGIPGKELFSYDLSYRKHII